MGKNKKKGNKNSTFYKAIKPYIKDNRVLYSILGAAGVGVALASVFGTDKGRELVDNFTNTLKNIGGNKNADVPVGQASQEPSLTEKKSRPTKPFAIEPS